MSSRSVTVEIKEFLEPDTSSTFAMAMATVFGTVLNGAVGMYAILQRQKMDSILIAHNVIKDHFSEYYAKLLIGEVKGTTVALITPKPDQWRHVTRAISTMLQAGTDKEFATIMTNYILSALDRVLYMCARMKFKEFKEKKQETDLYWSIIYLMFDEDFIKGYSQEMQKIAGEKKTE